MSNTIVQCNGARLVERGDELEIFENPLLPLPNVLALFLVRMFGYFALAAGAVTIAFIVSEREWSTLLPAAFIALIGVGILRGLAWYRKNAQSPVAQGPSLILAGGRLLDDQRRDLAALGDVRLVPHFQLGSSARALTLRWPSGARVIARGEPLGERVATMQRALHARGIPE